LREYHAYSGFNSLDLSVSLIKALLHDKLDVFLSIFFSEDPVAATRDKLDFGPIRNVSDKLVVMVLLELPL
jgi:hypothetical protein